MKVNKALLVLNFTIVYLVWGMTFIWMKLAAQDLHPFVIIFWQNLIAAIALIVINYRHSPFIFFKKNYLAIITQSFYMLICGVSFITISVDKLPASFAAIVIASVPIWVSLFNGISEKSIPLKRLTGILIGFVGLALLLRSESNLVLKNYFHLTLLVLASISWSFGLYRMNKLPIIASPYLSSAGQMLAASLIYLALILIFLPSPLFFTTNMQTISSIASLSILGSTIAFSSFNWLLKNTSPVKVSTYAYINPLVSILMACALLGESFKTNQTLYIVLILVSVFILVTDPARSSNESN